MTGRELIDWIRENGAEDLKVVTREFYSGLLNGDVRPKVTLGPEWPPYSGNGREKVLLIFSGPTQD